MRGGPRGDVFVVKHGLRGGDNRSAAPPEYKAWQGIVDRCCNPKNKDWKWYGGKGITIAPEWRNDPVAFMEHIGPRPSPKHSVDRIVGSLGYVPGNVKWSTPGEQARNRSNNRLVMIAGVTMPLVVAADCVGLRYSMVKGRLAKGWTEADALSLPAGARR